MKTYKNFLVSLILGLSFLIFSNISLADTKPSYLFLQSARSGELKKLSDDQYQLTLHEVAPYVIYLSDRPNRVTGMIKLTSFLQEWKKNKNINNFSADAPNVALHGAKVYGFFEKKYINKIVILSDPVYDPQNSTLTYLTKPLPDVKINMQTNPVHLSNITLFFDNVQGICLTC